jgi:hypothetical protein
MDTLNSHNRRLAEVVSGTDTRAVGTEPSSAPVDEFASQSLNVDGFRGERLGLSLLPSRMPAVDVRRYNLLTMGDRRDRPPSSDRGMVLPRA